MTATTFPLPLATPSKHFDFPIFSEWEHILEEVDATSPLFDQDEEEYESLEIIEIARHYSLLPSHEEIKRYTHTPTISRDVPFLEEDTDMDCSDEVDDTIQTPQSIIMPLVISPKEEIKAKCVDWVEASSKNAFGALRLGTDRDISMGGLQGELDDDDEELLDAVDIPLHQFDTNAFSASWMQ